MSKRTKITAIIIVVAAAAIIAAGATLAYFTADGGTKTNTFSTGSVTVELTEPLWDSTGEKMAEKYGPGDEIPKDPWVTNTDKTDAWVAIRVKYSLNNNQKSYEEFSQILTNGGLDFDKNNWDCIYDNHNEDGQVYMYKTKLSQGQKTEQPLFTKVPIAFDIPKDLMIQGELPSFVISVKGVGVQAENIDEQRAREELIQLAFQND